jgi:hypothetical protein
MKTVNQYRSTDKFCITASAVEDLMAISAMVEKMSGFRMTAVAKADPKQDPSFDVIGSGCEFMYAVRVYNDDGIFDLSLRVGYKTVDMVFEVAVIDLFKDDVTKATAGANVLVVAKQARTAAEAARA